MSSTVSRLADGVPIVAAMARVRLDSEMVRRSLAESRNQAAALIERGVVLVNGSQARKPAHQIERGDAVTVSEPQRYVGRGGHKLEAALEQFGIDVGGRHAIDVGSSTGGFTDCLLQSGARSVCAVDVGRAQLHDRLVRDEKVWVHEQTDIRSMDGELAGAPVSLIVMDVSFISVCSVIDVVVALLAPDGDVIVLVKPQFEVGREAISKTRGVVRDSALWHEAVNRVRICCNEAGLEIVAFMASPVRGAAGNVEFLAHLRPSKAAGLGTADSEALVSRVIDATGEGAP
jgi:23S rRNA (cytidine1920-2'-O)/16S rRNA (cytidine1409-2'-O)-methyltransferase